MNATKSGRAASWCSATLGSLSLNASTMRSYRAATESASGWSYTGCNSVRIQGHELFGVTAIKLVA